MEAHATGKIDRLLRFVLLGHIFSPTGFIQDEQMRFEYDSEEEVKMTKKPRKQRDPDFSLYKKKNYPELLKNFPKKSTKVN